jgi:hypothetical protein
MECDRPLMAAAYPRDTTAGRTGQLHRPLDSPGQRITMQIRRITLAALLAFGGASGAASLGAQQINTGTPPLGTEGGQVLRFTPFFAGNVAQTFVTPVGATTLTELQFWARNDASDFQLLGFHAHVFEWNDATLMTAPAPLWSSGLRLGTASATPQAFTFSVPALVLTPGQRYAAVLSPLETALPPTGVTYQGIVFAALGNTPGSPIDTYAGGAGYLLQTGRGAALSSLSTLRWNASTDYAFTATFAQAGPAVVPEPGTVALLASGLALVGLGSAGARRVRTRMR